MTERAELQLSIIKLPVPETQGALGGIFEAAIIINSHAPLHEFRRYEARAVVLVLEVVGEAEYTDETGRVRLLVPGDCILIDPRIGHRYGPRPGSRWTEMYVSFRGPLFDALELAANFAAEPVRRLGSPDQWKNRLRAVLPGAGGVESADACVGRLVAFLTEAFSQKVTLAGATDAWIVSAKRLLDTEHLNVAQVTGRLAAETGLSPETLRKRFRAVVGRSMKAWQLAGRIDSARSLLARGGMAQKEIAAALGFSHAQHFSRTLRKATGDTPGRLAKKSR